MPDYGNMHDRSRSSSHSRSRSRSHSRKRRYDRSRSRERYRDRSGSRDRRGYSRSPPGGGYRRRHIGTRDCPPEGKCLGIFGLSLRTTEEDLVDIFDRYPGFLSVKLINERGTGRSRGFGFIQFESIKDASYVKDKCLGMEIDERPIRIDYSITQKQHTPTPGIYMGQPDRGRGSGYYGGGGRERSPPRRRYRSRSFSRSRSPRY